MDAPSKLNKKKKSAFVYKGRKSHLTRTENLLKRQGTPDSFDILTPLSNELHHREKYMAGNACMAFKTYAYGKHVGFSIG